MKQTAKRVIAGIIAIAIVFSLTPASISRAKSNVQYYGCYHEGDTGEHTELIKAYIKNNRLYVKGCIQKLDKNYKFKKYVGSKSKTKSWKLKKGCKIVNESATIAAGTGEEELLSIEDFNNVFNNKEYYGLYFYIKVKNNKVVKISCSS